jgi:NADH dehydrogenase
LVRLFSDKDGAERSAFPDITLVDQNNFFLFTPMLTEVAGGEVDPDSIVVAVRSLSPRVTFEQGRVEKIDAAGKSVTISIGDEISGVSRVERTLSADQLVIALGSITNFHHISGLQEHSLTIKTVEEAEAIRDRALALLERADEEPNRDARRAMLTFVVGGGGFSGVETMAALNDLVRNEVQRFQRVDPTDVRTVLVHPGKRLLPEIDQSLAAYAQSKLEQRGVEVMLETEVTGAGADYVEVEPSHGQHTQRIPARTLVWAGGVKPSPAIDSAGLKLGHHHGIVVDACCRVPDHSGIWALGDCAEVPQPDGKGTYAPTAQNATREGQLVARNIVATLRGDQPQPFVYQPIGELALTGKHSGVASLYGMHFSGLPAWLMWRAIYLAKLPRLAKRVRVSVDWLLDALAGRELAGSPGLRGADRSDSDDRRPQTASTASKETRETVQSSAHAHGE